VALALSCAAGSPDPWNLKALEQAHPALAAVHGNRLKDVKPYTLVAAGWLTEFLCRWSVGESVPVAVDAGATPAERDAIEAALDAWEGADLGVRFERRERLARPYGIEIRVIENMLAGTANTIADCGVDAARLAESSGPVAARMVFASIHLARDDPRLTGSALHELGHALGFQGHPRAGETVMSPGMKAARLAGERVREGTLHGDAALSALYAVPSGTVLSRRPLTPERTRAVDALAEHGARVGWSGPFVRVGDREGRLFWRDARGDSVAFALTGLSASRTDPRRIQLTPNARAAQELGRLPAR
jgi:hypothetical protein